MELSNNCGRLNIFSRSGERDLGGVPSGLLYGVAVGVKLLRPHGVLYADGVTALIPDVIENQNYILRVTR